MPDKPAYFRRVIRVDAYKSPNVRFALEEISRGLKPSDTVVVPGILTWGELQHRLITWDTVRATIGIFGQWYEGSELLLYPPAWLDHSHEVARKLQGVKRQAKAIGVDPAEGGDETCLAAVDEYGLIDLTAEKTPDTSVITGKTIAFMKRHGVDPINVVFDSGGGGKQAADRLRAQGYPVKMVGFGEPLSLPPQRHKRQTKERLEIRDEKYVWFNRRAEMYGLLRQLLDPSDGPPAFGYKHQGWGIPGHGPAYQELRRQLAPMPLLYDAEGRMRMLPKNKPPNRRDGDDLLGPQKGRDTLVGLLGRSPDHADACVLSVFGLLRRKRQTVAGAI